MIDELKKQSALIQAQSPKFHMGQIVESKEGDLGVVFNVGIERAWVEGTVLGFTYQVAFPEIHDGKLYWPDDDFKETDLEAAEVEA